MARNAVCWTLSEPLSAVLLISQNPDAAIARMLARWPEAQSANLTILRES